MGKRRSDQAGPLALTPDLVARTARVIEDAGPSPGLVYMTDEDYGAAVEETLADHQIAAGAGPLWLFAYGSLLWKPACEVGERRRAFVPGWHRAFCFRVARFRGTLDRPGLMMALDRGGQCHGMIFRVAEPLRENLDKLFRREMTTKPSVNLPRWLMARTSEGPLRALGFVVNRRSERYVGKLTPDAIAEIVATAAGHWGSCADYLHQTVAHLEDIGIRDRNLWRLQRLVAEHISRHAVTESDAG